MRKSYFLYRVLVLVTMLFAAIFLSVDWDSLSFTCAVSLISAGAAIYVIDKNVFAGITDEEMEKICFLPKGFLEE